MSRTASEPDAIGQRLRWAREQAGLSQSQVARLLNIHRPTVSQIEAGQRHVRPNEITRLAELYGVKEAWIIKGESAAGADVDPRVELAARALSKLRADDLDSILRLIRVLRTEQEQNDD